jgi:diguanylate cyclase
MPIQHKVSLSSISLRRPIIPLAGILGLAFAATGLETAGTTWPLVGAAAAVAMLLVVAAGLAFRRRRPPWALLALAGSCDAVIVLLRHAQGGSTSGYAPLAILPVLWVALTLRRREVAVVVACTTATFALPLVVIGAPMYPSTGWRGVALWSVVSAVVGLVANRVMAEQRRQTRVARARARELDRLVATQTAIAMSPTDVEGVLNTVVEEARTLTRADAAVIELPDGAELVYRAVAGAAAPYRGLRIRADGAISGEALRTGEVMICTDSERDERVDRALCRRVGARSLVVVPLVDHGRATGVLKVYAEAPGAFDAEHAKVLTLLANIISSALARAQLLELLRAQASTDVLTGLPNRRSWHEHLENALARARRSHQPLSIVLLDLNSFKEINDRQGHAAGDRLLREVSSRWKATLREGDVLGRLGGDEFALLLEGADEASAEEVVARLDEAIAGLHSASAGTATWDRQEDAASLIARSDEMMYARKRARQAAAA